MWFKRKPDEETTVTAGKSAEAWEAMLKHTQFVNLCLRHDLRVARTDGALITVRGRPKDVERFKADFETLRAFGRV